MVERSSAGVEAAKARTGDLEILEGRFAERGEAIADLALVVASIEVVPRLLHGPMVVPACASIVAHLEGGFAEVPAKWARL